MHSLFNLACFLAATLFLLYLLWYNCFWKLSSLFKFILYLIEAMRLIYFVLEGHMTDFFLLCPVCKYVQIHWGSTFGYVLKNSFLFSHPWSEVTSLNDKLAFVNSLHVMFSKWMKTNQKMIFQMFFHFLTELKKKRKQIQSTVAEVLSSNKIKYIKKHPLWCSVNFFIDSFLSSPINNTYILFLSDFSFGIFRNVRHV